MLIPLGILASSGGAAGSYELISTTVLGSSQASVTFDVSTYASTYKHLQIRTAARTNRATATDYMRLRFNSDTGSNYNWHSLLGDGSAVYSEGNAPEFFIEIDRIAAVNSTTNAFGSTVIDFLDVFSSTKYKTIRSFGGVWGANDTTGRRIHLNSGAWRNTAVTTSLTLAPGGGTDFVTGSRFSIYGIKGA